jgi:hypothetical protein
MKLVKIFLLVISFKCQANDLSGGQIVEAINPNKIMVEFKLNSENIRVEFTRAGEPYDKKRVNKFCCFKRSRSGFKLDYLIAAEETSVLHWDSDIHVFQISNKKQIAFFLITKSWDGEDPSNKFLIVFTDGFKYETVKPEMSRRLDYQKETKEKISKYLNERDPDPNFLNNVSKEIIKIIDSRILRERQIESVPTSIEPPSAPPP